jgi:flagellar motor switch protein FliM
MRQLSQDEIDAVFQSRQAGSGSRNESKVIPFDFQKSDRIPKSQLRAIRFLHENFVRTLGSSLSGYLRAYTSGALVSVEQIPYSAFLDGLPPYTCMVSLSLWPYGDNAVLEINPALIFPALELLLGSKEPSAAAMNRELTDMERHILSNLFRLITTDLEHTWKGVDEVEFRVESLDTRRRSARTLGPSEAIVAIGMEFRIEDRIGMINLAIPSITMKSMVQKFDQQGFVDEVDPDEAYQQRTLKILGRAAVTVEPRVDSRLSVRDLLAMKVGSVVLFDHTTAQPIGCTANGKAKFEGSIVCEGERRAFAIESVTQPDLDRTILLGSHSQKDQPKEHAQAAIAQ